MYPLGPPETPCDPLGPPGIDWAPLGSLAGHSAGAGSERVQVRPLVRPQSTPVTPVTGHQAPVPPTQLIAHWPSSRISLYGS